MQTVAQGNHIQVFSCNFCTHRYSNGFLRSNEESLWWLLKLTKDSFHVQQEEKFKCSRVGRRLNSISSSASQEDEENDESN